MTTTIKTKANLSDQTLRKLLGEMIRIRTFEEELEKLYRQGEIHGTMHLCIGQEATAVGSVSLLAKTDWITSTHRNHGHSLAKGTNLKAMMAEILGRSTGTNHGKGGSMHIADLSVGNLGSNGIVGGGFPIATGAALTAQMNQTDQVVICYSGDGAVNEGIFHETLNLASIWQLPIIFMIENNQYGMSSPIDSMINIEKIADRAAAYGIEGYQIDGNNLIDVLDATHTSIQKVRGGSGPILIEALTYRHRGHSKSDQRDYRSREEERIWQEEKDPIAATQRLFFKHQLLTEAELTEMKTTIQEEVLAAIEAAKRDPRPTLDSLRSDVYAE